MNTTHNDAIPDSIVSKIKKLAALYERGVGGEVDNAKRALDAILGKYGKTLEDVVSDKRKPRVYKYKSASITMVIQVLVNLFGSDSDICKEARYNSKHKEVYINLTDVEYIDFCNFIEFHVKQFEKERKKLLKTLFSAYCSKHRLYDSSVRKDEGKCNLTDEEIMQIIKLSQTLEDRTYLKQIEQ